MDQLKNYYKILHVQQDAPSEVIQATYRTMMQKMKMHPDLGGDQNNAALINEAYAVLMDPVARAKYDASLQRQNSNQDNSQKTQTDDSQEKQTVAAPRRVLDPNHQCIFCELPHEQGSTIKPDSVCTRCGSALFPAAKQIHERYGKRVIQRIEKQWPVSFYTQWPITRGYIAKTQDVSLNGIQMLSQTTVQEGQILKLSSHMLDAVATVANVRKDHTLLIKRWRIGLQFVTLRFHQTQGTFLRINA